MRRCGWAMVLVSLALAGCVNPFTTPKTRMLSAEDAEREKDLELPIVGDLTEVANVMPLAVSGVGLVTGLDGTGGAPKGTFRTLLEQQLRKQKIENAHALLESPDNALVLVSALIWPGARRRELIDVEISLPPGSKASSLRGGYLQTCQLRNYDSKGHISPERFAGSNQLLQGHILALARGSLMVGFGSPEESTEQRRARIWGGGVSLTDRPIYFVLKKDDKSSRVANAVAQRINLMFQDDAHKQRVRQQEFQQLLVLDEVTQQLNHKLDHQTREQTDMAKALGKELIAVRVPYAYRLNPERYLRVARLIPLRDGTEREARYRRRLQKMILNPADTVRAALRLEAMGKESIPTLKQALESNHASVRFAAAEALAYLGSTTGVPQLVRLAREHSVYRYHGLLALASLDEAVCRAKLQEMLADDDAELRCGAFRALRLVYEPLLNPLQAEKAPETLPLGASLLGQAYWVHQVAPGSSPLITFAIDKRAEVVIFGKGARFVPPLKILAGQDFTVTAEPGDDRCTISRINSQGTQRKQCTFAVEDVLDTLAELGGQYPDAIDLLRKADDRQALTCSVRAHVLPAEVTVESLVEAGRNPDLAVDSDKKTP